MQRTQRTLASLALVTLALAPESRAQCPSWTGGFEQPGVNGIVYASAVYDDGSGPALYLAGSFSLAGDVSSRGIVRWDGSAFSAVGVGLEGSGRALAVHDDGSGLALYVGGRFDQAGGVAAANVARWSASGWSAVGAGLATDGPDGVLAFEAFDDGSGERLFAGGDFDLSPVAGAHCLAGWDGSSWTSPPGVLFQDPGPFISASISALSTHQVGANQTLWVGGNFIGVDEERYLAIWSGASWAALDDGPSGTVWALASYGGEVYVGGGFTTWGGVPVEPLMVGNGATWTEVPGIFDPVSARIQVLEVLDAGAGPELYVGGDFVNIAGVAPAEGIAVFDGTTWTGLDGGVSGSVRTVTVYDAGAGPEPYLGGDFLVTGAGLAPSRVARWTGAELVELGTAGAWVDGAIESMTTYDDGGGEHLYVGAGYLNYTGGLPQRMIGRFDGDQWLPMPDLSSSSAPFELRALAVFDDGSGAQLYAGGHFSSAAGVFGGVDSIARFDGSTWDGLPGTSGVIRALAVHDEGGSPKLYAGGDFFLFSGINIAAWDGTSWQGLASGTDDAVHALVSTMLGGAPVLVAGGDFTTAGGVAAAYVASWDGAAWAPMGAGLGGPVAALASFDAGAGAAVYAGGSTAVGVSRYDGAAWSRIDGSAIDGDVEVLFVHDGGAGPALYAGGEFTSIAGVPAARLARYDGVAWSPVGTGADGAVQAMTTMNGALLVGGDFRVMGGLSSARVARWSDPCAEGVASYCTAGTSASGCQAVLSTSGTPSASAATGFVVTAQDLEGDKDGLFFYGTQGPQANPWGNGTSYQCVVPPVVRAGLQPGTGAAGSCKGLAARDLNALWSSAPQKNPGEGATVQLQYWYRDPFGTSNQTTSLSDALEFALHP